MANNHSRKNVTKGLAVIVILCITCAVLGSVVGLTSGVFKHSQNITATQEMQYAFDNPNEMLSVVRLNTGVTIRGCDAEVCGTNYSEFQITNNSNMVLAIIASGNRYNECGVKFAYSLGEHLQPNESVVFYCKQDTKISPPDTCFTVYPNLSRLPPPLGEWCFVGRTNEFYLRGSPQDIANSATATAIWDNNIQITLKFGSEPNRKIIIGTIQNNTGQKLLMSDNAQTPIGRVYCYAYSGSNEILPGGLLDFYCYQFGLKDGAEITAVESLCLSFTPENRDYVEICKPIKP